MKPLTLSRRRALLTGLLLLPGIGFLIVVFALPLPFAATPPRAGAPAPSS
jgi:hypothetical protein